MSKNRTTKEGEMARHGYKWLGWGAALAAALLLMGCGSCWWQCGDGRLEADYGRSVTNNIAQQIVNPQAGQEVVISTGLTPKGGAGAMEKYDKSFKAEEKKAAESKLTTQ